MSPSVRSIVIPLLLLAAQPVQAANNFLPTRDTPVAADQQIPAVDFVRPPLFERPRLNPAGTHFAALTKSSNLITTVMVCEIATGKIELSNRKTDNFDWVDDTRLVVGQNGRQLPMLEIGNLRHVSDGFGYMVKTKQGLLPGSGFLWTWGWPEFLTAAIRDFSVKQSWFLPENGELAYSYGIDDTGHRKLRRLEKQKWVDCPVDCEEITPIEVGTKAGEMIVLGPRAKGKPRAIQRMDVVTGTLGEVIYQDATYDCLPYLSYKRGTRDINGVSVANNADPTVWLSETLRETQAMVRKEFPGMRADIISSDIREVRFIIDVQSDRQPSSYYLLDREKNTLTLLNKSASWIESSRMQSTRVLTYKTRDGVTIEGYLTLPAGASKEHPAPLVVRVHGGPWETRVGWGWNSHVQFLANRGYAVFSPNYRGSAGYDSRIDPADRFAFEKMRDDINSGVRALAKSGLIDARRVAIDGVGFGGYLALSAVVQDKNLYQCAIVHGGIYDWERAFREPDSRNMYDERWLREQLRRYDQHPPSPLKDFEQINAPVMFIRNVQVFDITFEDQLMEMHRALKGHSPVLNFGDLNLYREEDAYEEIVTQAEQIEKFLGQYVPVR